jgi:multiple sugar transport system permease protein
MNSINRRAQNKKCIYSWIRFVFVIVIALISLYPLLWMLSSSFKPTSTIFDQIGLVPKNFTLENYVHGWRANGRVTFSTYFKNSFMMVAFAVIGNVMSCSLAAYAFARLDFKLKKIFFPLMFITVMLPHHAVLIPQYVFFKKLDWINTFFPIIVPKFLAVDAFFVYLIVQFIRGIPRELDEAAIVDGCNKYTVFSRIILPLVIPAIITTIIFTFIWTWNDFFTQMVYLSNPKIYTVSLGLRTFVDPTSMTPYGYLFAMSVASILPIMILFAFFQRYLIEGIVTSGIKG